MVTGYNSLRIRYNNASYIQLSNSIQSYLHVTNRRRAGEIEKLSIEDFNAMQVSSKNCRIQVRGKRTKPVPIVFNRTVLKYLKLLIDQVQEFLRKILIFSQPSRTSQDSTSLFLPALLWRSSPSCVVQRAQNHCVKLYSANNSL